jgi:hypothetical protein
VVIEPGNAAKSELFRRINLPTSDKEAMPSKGKTLTKEEIKLLEFWLHIGAPWPENLEQQSLFPKAELAPRNTILPTGAFENPIDLWVNDYFTKNNIVEIDRNNKKPKI